MHVNACACVHAHMMQAPLCTKTWLFGSTRNCLHISVVVQACQHACLHGHVCVVSHAYVLCHSAVAQQEHWQVDHAVSKTLLHVVVHLLLPMLHAPPSLVWSGLAPCIRLKGTNMAASLWSHASCMCNNNGKSMGCKGVGSWCYAYIQPCV